MFSILVVIGVVIMAVRSIVVSIKTSHATTSITGIVGIAIVVIVIVFIGVVSVSVACKLLEVSHV